VQGALEAAGPRGAPPPCPCSSLYLLGTIEDPFPLDMAAKGEENSQLWVVPLKNRVSGQYIVLEASPGSSDQNPWIQGLLGTSRTFMVTSRKAHKSPNSKTWLGQTNFIWQEFESTTSPTFGIPKLLPYPSVIGAYLAHQYSVSESKGISNFTNSPQLSC
jgi:hypothetical protein